MKNAPAEAIFSVLQGNFRLRFVISADYHPLLAACDVEIDSKELRKDYAKMLSAAGDQVRIKKAVLDRKSTRLNSSHRT